jgi:anionic cell wall polymer biosynthesis LytR-Cps2A-Psr (LCP) family protein
MWRDVELGYRVGLDTQIGKHGHHITASVAHFLEQDVFLKLVSFPRDESVGIGSFHDDVKGKVSCT